MFAPRLIRLTARPAVSIYASTKITVATLEISSASSGVSWRTNCTLICESGIPRVGDVFVDFFRVNFSGIFQDDACLNLEECLVARTLQSVGWLGTNTLNQIASVRRCDMLVEEMIGLDGNERSRGAQPHASGSAHATVRVCSRCFLFEGFFQKFAVQ